MLDRQRLRGEGFEDLPGVRAPVCAYCLLRKGRVVYVGKTKNVFTRIGQHWMKQTSRRRSMKDYFSKTWAARERMVFDEVLVKWCEKRELDHWEMTLIHRFNPEYNIQIREKLPKVRVDLAQIIAKAGLEGWKRNFEESSPPLRRRRLG